MSYRGISIYVDLDVITQSDPRNFGSVFEISTLLGDSSRSERDYTESKEKCYPSSFLNESD